MTMRVRANDAIECAAAGFTPTQALARCLALSDETWQHKEGGKVVAMWGFRVRGFLTQTVDAWLLTSEEVAQHKVKFARKTRRWVDELFSRGYASIYCEVHAAYHDAVKWLVWLGFRQVDVRVVGGESFLIMRKDRG